MGQIRAFFTAIATATALVISPDLGYSSVLAQGGSPAASQTSFPKTVRVGQEGAAIYVQPQSSSQVIGKYRAGAVLTPSLRAVDPEGQVWLKIGISWVLGDAVIPMDGSTASSGPAPSSSRKPSTTSASPSATPSKPASKPSTASASPPSSPPQSSPNPSTASSPSKASPKASPASASSAPAGESFKLSPPPASSTTKTAVLYSQDKEAGINVRSEPTTESSPVGYGLAGDRIEIRKQVLGSDTYTWYYVKFVDSKTEGWVRGDFVDRQKSGSPSSSASPSNSRQAKTPSSAPTKQPAPPASTATKVTDSATPKSDPKAATPPTSGDSAAVVKPQTPAPAATNPPAPSPQTAATSKSHIGSLTAPAGVVVTLQSSPTGQIYTPFWGASGEKVKMLKMTKGKDGLAWYYVKLLDNPAAKGWVRGDEVRLLTDFSKPWSAALSAPSGSLIYLYEDPTSRRTHLYRGNSGETVEVLKQTKGENSYAWYYVRLATKPDTKGWVRGENIRLSFESKTPVKPKEPQGGAERSHLLLTQSNC